MGCDSIGTTTTHALDVQNGRLLANPAKHLAGWLLNLWRFMAKFGLTNWRWRDEALAYLESAVHSYTLSDPNLCCLVGPSGVTVTYLLLLEGPPIHSFGKLTGDPEVDKEMQRKSLEGLNIVGFLYFETESNFSGLASFNVVFASMEVLMPFSVVHPPPPPFSVTFRAC